MDLIIIRSSIVNTYLLIKNEGLWEKYLPTQVEKLLNQDPRFFEYKTSPSTTISLPSRDKSKVVQIYDYKSKKVRIIFRPKLGQL
jgi:hypothetical protein